MKKYKEIVNQMLWDLFNNNRIVITGRVITGSMKYLINVNDKIEVKKNCIGKIKLFDIIVFKNETQMIVHRVIYKFRRNNELHFVTKGDSSLFPDKFLVSDDEFIGKVVGIKKDGKEINLETFSGKVISLFYFVYSYLIGIVKYVDYKLKKGFGNNKEISKIKKFYIETDFGLWKVLNKTVKKYLVNTITKSDKIGEINFFGGYSEISMEFIRQNFDIELIDIKNFDEYSSINFNCLLMNSINFCFDNRMLELLKKIMDKIKFEKFIFVTKEENMFLIKNIVKLENIFMSYNINRNFHILGINKINNLI